MKRSTIAALLWTSLATAPALLLPSCAGQTRLQSTEPLHIERFSRYKTDIATPQARMSGIIFLQQSEGGWTGRMLNEFGLGMFDFSVRRGKCKLSNMMPMIDKWYIRRTVAGDLGYLLGEGNDGRMSKGHAIERRHGGGFIMTNTRRRITYTFHPIRQ